MQKQPTPFNLVCIFHIAQKRQMKIPVADMPDNRSYKPRFRQILLRRLDTIGKPRNRHANIGRDNL